MWNKSQPETEPQRPEVKPSPPAPTTPDPVPSRIERQAVLGPSIKINGSLSGEEDLLIEGHVEGEVSFRKHAVTVGKRGKVKADLYCKSIYVEGEVHGNLYGDELVVVRKSANVRGNAVAPRVSLEDGSQFHGAIDMQPKPSQPASAKPGETHKPKAGSEAMGKTSIPEPNTPASSAGTRG